MKLLKDGTLLLTLGLLMAMPLCAQEKEIPWESIFNGKDLTGWRLTSPNAASGWSVQDGVLTNHPDQEEGKPHKRYGNLRTEREFEDFNLTLETRVPEGGNSGIYLRGIYEVQVANTFFTLSCVQSSLPASRSTWNW